MYLTDTTQASLSDAEILEEEEEEEVSADTEDEDDLFNAEFRHHKANYYMEKMDYVKVTK